MSMEFKDEKLNKSLIKIFKELENIDIDIEKLNAEIKKHIDPFEIPEESKEPVVIDLINRKELCLHEYNSLINVAKNLANTKPKPIRLKCDYFTKNFSNTQNSLDYINSKLRGESVLAGTRELFTSLAYNSTVSSYSPLNIYYVAYKLPQIFGHEVTIIHDQMEQEKSDFNVMKNATIESFDLEKNAKRKEGKLTIYNEKDLNIIKHLINKEIKEQSFNLGMAETELRFSINNIKEKGEGHKPFQTDLTLGEFKEMAETTMFEIKNELEKLNSLYLKTNTLLSKELDKKNYQKPSIVKRLNKNAEVNKTKPHILPNKSKGNLDLS